MADLHLDKKLDKLDEKDVGSQSARAIRSPFYPVSIAPMMDRTDRHYRRLMRCITKRTLLYTEMVTTAALLLGDRKDLLDFSPEESPVALQLGGDDPRDLASCARLGEESGYVEVNLNVGCPSQRVQKGRFGACLMAEPSHVADCVAAMREAVSVPVTVKHRTGIDDRDSYEELAEFVSTVAEVGCDRFTVHARKAILSGLSPKQNRAVPPLQYDFVHRLKEDFPHLQIEINGGFSCPDEIARHLTVVDGVMVGRAAFDSPMLFADVDHRFYGSESRQTPLTSREVLAAILPYVRTWVEEKGEPLPRLAKPMIGLCANRPGARRWRRYLNDRVYKPTSTIGDLEEGLGLLEEHRA